MKINESTSSCVQSNNVLQKRFDGAFYLIPSA